jgi:hypothetical protein
MSNRLVKIIVIIHSSSFIKPVHLIVTSSMNSNVAYLDTHTERCV